MADTAKLNFEGKDLELPVLKGTIGPDVLDIGKLYAQSGTFTFDPGFTSTAACKSAITYIDGDEGILQFARHIEQRIILHTKGLKHLMGRGLKDLGARIVILIDPVSKAHQTHIGILVLHLFDEGRNFVDGADLFQHFQCRFIGATMGWAPEAGNASSDTGKGIGTRRARQAHGRRGGILLMVSMQREDPVHGAGQGGMNLIFLTWHGKAHVQEVGSIRQVIARINERLAHMVFEGHCGNGRQLGNHPVRRNFALAGISDVS